MKSMHYLLGLALASLCFNSMANPLPRDESGKAVMPGSTMLVQWSDVSSRCNFSYQIVKGPGENNGMYACVLK